MFLRSIRPCGSTPLAGSSSSSTWGSGIRVLASISRCRIPRDSSPTSALRFSVSPTSSRWRSTTSAPRRARDAVAGGEQVEELPDHQVLVHRREVGHEPDEPADVLGLLAHVDAHDLDLAVSRLDQAEHRAASSSSCPPRWARSARRPRRPRPSATGRARRTGCRNRRGDRGSRSCRRHPRPDQVVMGPRLFVAAAEFFGASESVPTLLRGGRPS